MHMRQGSTRTRVQARAFWDKKVAPVVDEEPKSKTTSNKAKTTSNKPKTTSNKPATTTERKKESAMSQALNAFDFSEARSQKDADLLYEAKYGDRSPDGKMSREQYEALRRKVGGTAKSFFKEYVEDESLKYIKTYTKPGSGSSVPYLPFLVGVVLAMLATTAVVVSRTL